MLTPTNIFIIRTNLVKHVESMDDHFLIVSVSHDMSHSTQELPEVNLAIAIPVPPAELVKGFFWSQLEILGDSKPGQQLKELPGSDLTIPVQVKVVEGFLNARHLMIGQPEGVHHLAITPWKHKIKF